MSEQNDSTPAPTSGEGVPGELIDQLHNANEKLAHAREHVEAAENAEINVLAKREAASNDVRDAEEEIEKADEKIREAFRENEKR